jgi:hypothetical protein
MLWIMLLSVWTISAGYMRKIALTLTSSVKIACLYISVDPIVTRMTHDNKGQINRHKQEQQHMVILLVRGW